MGETLIPSTTCSQSEVHADINGDGIVDSLDELFVTLNMMTTDKETCCPDPNVPPAIDTAVTSISIRDLRLLGLAHLVVADRNGDGFLDLADVTGPFVNAAPKIPRKGGR